MKWTPWITIEQEDTTNPDAAELFAKTRSPLSGVVSDLVKITSRTPRVARLINDLAAAVYSTTSGLTWREKEIAALVTSSLNGCVH